MNKHFKLLFLLLFLTPVFAEHFNINHTYGDKIGGYETYINNSAFDGTYPDGWNATNDIVQDATSVFDSGTWKCTGTHAVNKAQCVLCSVWNITQGVLEDGGQYCYRGQTVVSGYNGMIWRYMKWYNSTSLIREDYVYNADTNIDASFCSPYKVTSICLNSTGGATGKYIWYDNFYAYANSSLSYYLSISSPENKVYYDIYVPLTAVTNRTTSILQYQFTGWGTTWKNMTSTTINDGVLTATYNLYYLDAGSYTVFVKDDLGSTVNTSFTVSRITTPAPVNLISSINNKFSCTWKDMSLEHGQTGQNYVAEIWKNGEFINSRTFYIRGIRYPNSIGIGETKGVENTPSYYAFNQYSQGLSNYYNYVFYITPDDAVDYNEYTCRVMQIQDSNAYTSLLQQFYTSNFGTAYLNVSNPYVRFYRIDLLHRVWSPSSHNAGEYGYNITMVMNTDNARTVNIEHSNTNFLKTYSYTAPAGVSYYNITLEHGLNNIKVKDFLNTLLHSIRVTAYDTSAVNNVTLKNDYGDYICSSNDCNYNIILRKGVLEINSTVNNREIQVYAYIVNSTGSMTPIYENGINSNQDNDGDNSVLTLYTNEEYDESDIELNAFLTAHPNYINLDMAEFFTRLNNEYVRNSQNEQAQLRIYVPANEKIMVTASLSNTTKNVTFTPRYDILNAIKYSDIGTQLITKCSLKPAEKGKSIIWSDHLTYYFCLGDYYISNYAVNFIYLVGFVACIMIGQALLSLKNKRLKSA